MSDPLIIDIQGFVRWNVPDGVSVVIGPNGSGKTRLIAALSGVSVLRGQLIPDRAVTEYTSAAFPHLPSPYDAPQCDGLDRFTDVLIDRYDPCLIDDAEKHLAPHAIRVLVKALVHSERRCVITTHSSVLLNCRDVTRDCVWVLDARAPDGIVNLDTTDDVLRRKLGWPSHEFATHFSNGDLWANEELGVPR